MSEPVDRAASERVPVLTEVLGEPAPSLPPTPPVIDEKRLVEDIMAALQQRVDLSFEYRVREAVAPVLEKLAQTIVAEARVALSATLRDVVARAVAQEVAKRQRR